MKDTKTTLKKPLDMQEN